MGVLLAYERLEKLSTPPPDQYRAAPLRGPTESAAQLESPELVGLGKHLKSAFLTSIQMVLI